jgi:hypothetical protein
MAAAHEIRSQICKGPRLVPLARGGRRYRSFAITHATHVSGFLSFCTEILRRPQLPILRGNRLILSLDIHKIHI